METTSEPFGFYVFQFTYKDDLEKYIGVNVIDGRFMIIEPPEGFVPPSPGSGGGSGGGGGDDTPPPPQWNCDPNDEAVYHGNSYWDNRQNGGRHNSPTDGVAPQPDPG